MFSLTPLGSGSKGNAVLLQSPRAKYLVDVGFSAKQMRIRLEALGISIHEIDAVFITHEHGDHVSGLKQLNKIWQGSVPIFANSETARAIFQRIQEPLPFSIFSTGVPFDFSGLDIFPFSIQHDAVDPVAFRFTLGEASIGICTDLGCVQSSIVECLSGVNVLYTEANHDVKLVQASTRTQWYKNRVLGRLGHLSNHTCAQLLKSINHEYLEAVYFAHLSQECNSPDLLLNVMEEEVRPYNAQVKFYITTQESIGDQHTVWFQRDTSIPSNASATWQECSIS